MTWWWLSFAGPHFLGAAAVRGVDAISAIRESHRLGINPGGEVMALRAPTEHGDPPERLSNRLLQIDEADTLSREWAGCGLQSTLDEDN